MFIEIITQIGTEKGYIGRRKPDARDVLTEEAFKERRSKRKLEDMGAAEDELDITDHM